jgi:hypothetical protein
MNYSDQMVFLEAANRWKVWIVVRRSNPKSEPYVGNPQCAPKPIDCKAKTADLDVDKGGMKFKTAGLVTNPWIHPEAFPSSSLSKVREEWKTFESKWLHPPRKYTVDMDRSHPHHGCVMLEGRYLYSDYDLFDIIDSLKPFNKPKERGRYHGNVNLHSSHFKPVMNFVNSRIKRGGKPVWMIQHGEARCMDQELDGGGADVFGPLGKSLPVSCHFDLCQWFQREFGGTYQF